MKKLLVILLTLFVAASASADSCTVSLGSVFTPAQREELCSFNGLQSRASLFEAVAGTGTNQATGAALASGKYIHQITGANGTVAWVLPAASSANIGRVHILLNTTAGIANIYPAGTDTINGAAASAVFTAPTGIHALTCVQTTATAWICA